jgi:hypothetical protein
MPIRRLIICLALLSSGCVNIYTHVDRIEGSDREEPFKGIRQHVVQGEEFHVLQVHGMGDHQSTTDCGPASPNIKLQESIAAAIGLTLASEESNLAPQPIYVGATLGGTYSTRVYEGLVDGGKRRLYFSCVTWGEASREIKRKMLELDDDFLETNANEAHRSLVNRQAKRFVNEKLSDPLIYVGRFGPFIREALVQGITAATTSHQQRRRGLRIAPNEAAKQVNAASAFMREVRTAVISDSLGSRVVFDVMCEAQPVCPTVDRTDVEGFKRRENATQQQFLVADAARWSIRSIYMLANQLPLLELAALPEPGTDTPLGEMLANGKCYLPLGGSSEKRFGEDAVEIVAFTDANDALSYHLTGRFKRRCAPDPSQIRIVNVTLPNADFRWLFVYSHLPEAHSDGFKTNAKAIRYLVHGNEQPQAK